MTEHERGPRVAAVVDVGSNSVHLLVARMGVRGVEPLADESLFLGLGDAVSASGLLGRDARRRLVGALGAYVARARTLAAARIVLAGTAAIRAAPDAARLVEAVERELGVPFLVLEPHEEALLTFLGATVGPRADGPLIVADIGGGSSEFVVARPGRQPIAVGVPLGSATLTARHVTADPPGPDALNAVAAAARELLRSAPEAGGARLVAVGGTAENVLKLLPGGVEGGSMSGAQLDDALAILAREPADDLAARFVLRPTRARLLPAGGAILRALLDHLGAPGLVVSRTGLREGVVLAVANGGPSWRDSVPALAASWLA